MTEHYIGPAPRNSELGITMVDDKQSQEPEMVETIECLLCQSLTLIIDGRTMCDNKGCGLYNISITVISVD